MIKRIFKYVEHLWIGDDGHPSIRRVLAIAFSISLIYNVGRSLKSLEILVAIVSKTQTLNNADAATISAVGTSLANASTILAILAGLIAGLLGLTTLQSMKFGKPENCLPGSLESLK